MRSKSAKQDKFSIDQSGKVEDTSKNTILCLSNGYWDAVLVRTRTKRQLQEIFRRNGQIRNFVLFTFSAILAILLKRNGRLLEVTVDREYFGKEAIIKKIVLEMLGSKINTERKLPEIYFGYIGKKAMSHNRAYAIGLKKLKAKKNLSLKEVLARIKKTEVGKRLKDA